MTRCKARKETTMNEIAIKKEAAKAKARQLMTAARVPDKVTSGEFGVWTIRRIDAVGQYHRNRVGRERYTALHRHTWATMHRVYGEIVMEDSDPELRQHLPVWMRAQGRVLVTGLGLGCVVRGLTAKEEVEKIDVIEIDRKIIEKIGPEFEADARVRIIEGDALKHPIGNEKYEFAWHDLWIDEIHEDKHLQMVHAEVLERFRNTCEHQGAWKLPRFVRRMNATLATLY